MSYDNCNTMSGINGRCQKLFFDKQSNPMAIFIEGFSHASNLCAIHGTCNRFVNEVLCKINYSKKLLKNF